MSVTTPEIISGVALGLAIISFLWQRFGVILDIKKEQAQLALSFQKDIADCRNKCTGHLESTKDSIYDNLSKEIKNISSQLSSQITALSTQLTSVDTRVTKQEMKMDLFWGAVQETVKDMIKQPIHFRKDELLDKFPNLSYEDICELRETLHTEKVELLSNIKKLEPDKKSYLLAVVLMLARVDGVLVDRGDKC